jgi:hypothetical protein
MYSSHFLPSDFCISKEDVPVVIMDKIFSFHLLPLNKVQDATPFEVFVSYSVKGQPSSWRPRRWELEHNRNGFGQHTFGQQENKIIENEKGATDITCEDFETNKGALLEALIKETDYLRFAVYNSFIHADYKNTHDGKRLLFSSNRSSKWTFIKFI